LPSIHYRNINIINHWFMTVGKMLFRSIAGLSLVLIAACASAPVQEMSDARLALQAAQAVGAQNYSPDHFLQAQQLLQQAEEQLAMGAYTMARQLALNARDSAIRAREIADNYQGIRQ
jgi:hypothetical protein